VRLSVGYLVLLSVAGSASATLHAAEARKAPPPDRAREAVIRALAASDNIPVQAKNLANLAWPAGKRDEVISARARHELVGFGDHAFVALRDALNTVKIAYTEEVLTTTLAAHRNARVEAAPEYIGSVLDALWVGSHAAKVVAMDALAERNSPLALNSLIDSAIDDPTLAPRVVEILGPMRYQQARFYLEKVMMEGPPTLRPVAASSLAQIGGAALGPLKNALKAPNRDARLLAARALLPAATDYDVGAIYEYIEKHGDDDPTLTQSLKDVAIRIEKAISARDASAAADTPKDF
jgi:hypothetical protein